MSLFVSTGRLTRLEDGQYWTIHILFDADSLVAAAKHAETLSTLVQLTGKLNYYGFAVESYGQTTLVEQIIINLTTGEVAVKQSGDPAMLKGFAKFLLEAGVVFDAANTPE